MNKHINITSKTYYSRGRVTFDYNQWNYYLSYNKYPIAVYFSYYSDSNSLIHQIREQLIHVGGKGHAGPGGQQMYVNKGMSWTFLTKGNILTLFFPTWAVFASFMRGPWGVKIMSALPLITLSIQGNYLNLSHTLGIKEILKNGDNYSFYLISATHHLQKGSTAFIPILSIIIYNLVWIITSLLICLAVCVQGLSNNTLLLQEYRSTLLTSTPNITQ